MIKQQICKRSADGHQTEAVSAALRESAWLPLLDRQSAPPEQPLAFPAYYQCPFGTGLLIGCYTRTQEDAFLVHALIADEGEDLGMLRLSRPLPESLFKAQMPEDTHSPLPTLSPESLFDAEKTSEGFKLIDSLFDEALLARFIKAVLSAAEDKRCAVEAAINQPPAVISEQSRLIMEMLMRCLPLRETLRLSWHTFMDDDASAMPYSVIFSTPHAASGRIYFDLSRGTVIWPDEPPTDEKSLTLARALLAHDLNWADRSDSDSTPALSSLPALHMDTPPFERGMSLRQYMADWGDALDIRRGILNAEAFETLAHAQWPQLINSVINAADLMPHSDFIEQLTDCLNTLLHGRGAELCMTGEHLKDLAAILLDSLDWDEIDLFDPATVRLVKSATEYAALLDEERCSLSRLTACRIIHTLTTAPAAHLSAMLDDLRALNEMNPALFAQLQACVRRYITGRCRLVEEGRDEFSLADEPFVAAAIAGYVRFSRGIPDLRALEKLRGSVERIAGAREVRRFNARLDRMRKRMSTYRTADHARKRELKLMLLISLLLSLIIIGVVIAYFFFLK